MSEAVRVTIWVKGHVQGVGFRWWVRARALELGLAGHAANLEDGRVEVRAEGLRSACAALVGLLEGEPSGRRPGVVGSVVVQWSAPDPDRPAAGFRER